MIDHITPAELHECVVLSDKGWGSCSEEERKRWTQLHAKALRAKCTMAVHEIIQTAKTIDHARLQGSTNRKQAS